MDIKLLKKIILGGFVVIVLVLFGYEFYKQKNILNNQVKTEGKIIDFLHINRARYAVKYEYSVNAKKYIGQVGISPFKCDNGKEGCVGQNFTVYYSSENPSYSKIYLEKYEKYKTKVEFFD